MKTISRYIMTLALLITAVTGAWAADTYTITFSGFGNEACNKTVTDATLEYSETFTVNDVDADYMVLNDVGGSNEYVSISYQGSDITITVKSAFEGTVKVTVYYVNIDGEETERNISVTCVKNAPAIDVTTNAASEQDLFTEASFNMPAYDATAEYELVRDMSIQMTAKIGDGTDGVRYRVKKAQQGEGYEPADLSTAEVMALVAVNDGIEHKALTLDQDYTVLIYPVDENGQILSGAEDGVTFENFTYAPGLYALKAFAKDDSPYAGETALSNTFKLFQGYEVQVAAKEFITYYKDEPLYVEDEAAELYTIQSVNGDQAVLSDRSDAMPSNTPMLVYNKSNETKVILLIPCAEPDMTLTVAPEFQGTLTGTTIAASTDAQTNYAFNGKQFVWVKDAIEVGPNKAWLEIGSQAQSARQLNLVFGDATGINGAYEANGASGNSDWYDLSGRKLNAAPTRKGVYILNGKKIVIK